MKAFLTILAAVLAMPLAAQDSKAISDTIVVMSPSSVVVTKGRDGAIGVSVKGKDGNSRYRFKYNTEVEEKDTADWNLDLPFLKKRNGEWIQTGGGIYNNSIICNGEPAGSGLHSGFELGVTYVVGTKYNFGESGLFFSTGLGFDFKMFFSEKSELRFGRDKGVLILEPLPEGVTEGKLSMIHWSLDMPLQFTQRIGKNFGITGGILLKRNFYTSVSNKYKQDGVQYTETVKHLNQRRFSYEYMGSVGWKNFSVFCKYNPQGLFRNGFGPQFNTLSIGLRYYNF